MGRSSASTRKARRQPNALLLRCGLSFSLFFAERILAVTRTPRCWAGLLGLYIFFFVVYLVGFLAYAIQVVRHKDKNHGMVKCVLP